MGLLTNLVQMKANRDLQAKETAIEGFKSVLTNKNATPEMRQWAQQGVLDLTTNAIAGEGKGAGGKKQHAGVKQVLGSILGGLATINPMASGPSKGTRQQIAGAMANRPQKMELTEEEREAIVQRQQEAADKLQLAFQAKLDAQQAAFKREEGQKDWELWLDRGQKQGLTGRDLAEYAATKGQKLPNVPAGAPKVLYGKIKGQGDGVEILTFNPRDPSGYQDAQGNTYTKDQIEITGPPQPNQRLYGQALLASEYVKSKGYKPGSPEYDYWFGQVANQLLSVPIQRTQQAMGIAGFESGIGPGQGMPNIPENPNKGETAPAPGAAPARTTPGARTAPGAPAPGVPGARTPFTGIAPGAPGAPRTAAPGTTGTNDRFIGMFMDSLYGNLPGGTGGPARIGVIKGREALRKATGLDPVTFSTLEAQSKESLKTFNQIRLRRGAVDQLNSILGQFGDEAVKRAKGALQTGSPFLNKHIRDIELAAVGDPDLRRFLVAFNGFERQYTNLTAGGTFSRAMLPVATGDRVDKVLNPNATLAEVIDAVDQVKIEGQREQQGLKDSEKDTIQEAVDAIKGKPTSTPTGTPTGTPTPGGTKLSPAAKRYLDRVMGR